MAADVKSRPYNPKDPYEHCYVSAKYTNYRVVYERAEGKGTKDRYLGFLHMAVGGVFQTNDEKIAAYIEALDDFKDGDIVKVTHAELGEMMSESPADEEKVSQGAVGTTRAKAPLPAPPLEDAPPEPRAARGPRRKPVLA